MPSFLLYSDWLTALGGGERYLYAIADAVGNEGEVTIAGPELPDGERMQRLGFSSAYRVREIGRPSLPSETAAYDVFVHLTTRLPMRSAAGRSVAIVQFPADNAGAVRCWRHPRGRLRSGRPRLALSGYEFIVYSDFVRGWLRRRWHVDAEVLTPPLLLNGDQPSLDELLPQKHPQILSVGRFFGDGRMKRQGVLIEAYRRLPAGTRRGWRLVLAGSVGADGRSRVLIESLRSSAEGLDVRFALDQPPWALEALFCSSSIYWHAAGFGRPSWRPDRAEHFGMATVEAMSRAAAPVVFPDGGQREIVTPGVGRTWYSVEQLVELTSAFTEDPALLAAYQRRAYDASSAYSLAIFQSRARALLAPGLGAASSQ
ncbi:MAG: glycosyltransferase [Actinomycetota bacterium]|nr:glycosyltransferase [Actinomycetota bacterium]